MKILDVNIYGIIVEATKVKACSACRYKNCSKNWCDDICTNENSRYLKPIEENMIFKFLNLIKKDAQVKEPAIVPEIELVDSSIVSKIERYHATKELTPVLGKIYSGIGYSGLTDGVKVFGKLTEITKSSDHAILWCERRNLPCAVRYSSLKPII